MSLAVAARFARREMRGGLRGFRVFLVCLALGVAAIAAVGTVRENIQGGLSREGAVLLGGDAEIELTYRFAEPAELAWMKSIAGEVSEVVDFRSMAVFGDGADAERSLTQIKAVDDAYPLYGSVGLSPEIPLDQALDGSGGFPGAVMDRILAARLGMELGDVFRLGNQPFALTAILAREPDSSGGFTLGPRTVVRTTDLAGSGLLQPGTLFETDYRMTLPADADLPALKAAAAGKIEGGGGRWRDRRDGAPGARRFIERLATFLILVGLAGLVVGGVGISAAVRAYLDEKIPTIATLKSVGAQGRTIFQVYLIQIAVLSALGILIGLMLGAALPYAVTPLLQSLLPVPPETGIAVAPLAEAAAYGALTAAVFALWPLARTERVRAAALFREAAFGLTGRPSARYIVIIAALMFLLVSLAVAFSGQTWMTLWAAAGLFGAFVALVVAGHLLRLAAGALGHLRLFRGLTALRHALAAVGGPGGDTATVVVSLGLGLSVLAAIGQIDRNLQNAIAEELPDIAPSFFFVDIQTSQLEGFLDRLENDPAVSRVDTAPMLRGVITEINGIPAVQAVGPHWAISGDRGITYSDRPQDNAPVVEGAWWPQDYAGEPQISLSATEADEMGLTLGDRMTVNILGREVTGTITSFRAVDFSDAGMGFVLAMNPAAIRAAPHSHIATVYSDEAAEGAILRDLATAYPNITAIGVREAITRVSAVLQAVSGAITYGAMASLLTGAVVLIGAAAAGERARAYEAAILKTLGASRSAILLDFSLRSIFTGAAAGLVAVLAGGVAGWAVMTFVMEVDYRFEPLSAGLVILAGIGLTTAAGAAFSWRALSVKPARTLRAQD